jgi:hypothetical protein
VERHVVDLRFDLLAIRDIVRDSHGADDMVSAIPQRHFGGENPTFAAILPGLFFLDPDQWPACANNLLFVRQGLVAMFGAENIEVSFVDGIYRIRKAKIIGHGSTDQDKAAFAILKIDVIGYVLKKSVEQLTFYLRSAIDRRTTSAATMSVNNVIDPMLRKKVWKELGRIAKACVMRASRAAISSPGSNAKKAIAIPEIVGMYLCPRTTHLPPLGEIIGKNGRFVQRDRR